ncbi:MAG: hypothetical protein JXR77_15695 [Lentisphaeria bacterium]|nr:hypothetical protein [Lentisphaeria bacterium]
MITIVSPRHGAVLNRHDGVEDDGGLTVRVEGRCGRDGPVTVNGSAAKCTAGAFTARVTLTSRQTVIEARCGAASAAVTALYDRGSFPRYRFSLDDNIRFLRDIARSGCRSLFDHPYMALWRRLHRTYGTKVNCNVYFQGDGFDLSMMPDRYRGEWRDNAHWFRLTFHALQNDPAEPYLRAGYEEVARDFDRVTAEIRRFAGEEVTNTFTTIHWGEATREGCRAVRDRGILGLCGYFHLGAEGRPKVSYYLDADATRHLAGRQFWKDFGTDLLFIRHTMVINTVPAADIAPALEATAANPHQRDAMELMIHEQYFYPDYRAYLPDYADRCETAVRWVTDHGHRPVFWSDGFLGTPE